MQSKVVKHPYLTFIRVMLFYACSVVVFAFISGLTKRIHSGFTDLFSIFLATLLTFLLILFFVHWDKIKLKNIGFIPGRKEGIRFVSGFTIGFIMVMLQVLITLCFGHYQIKLEQSVSFISCLPFLFLYFFAALREELVSRSYTLRSLNYATGPITAIIITTVLFITEHIVAGMDWRMAILGNGLGAILFSVAALKTKGLALPLGLHFAWNLGQWLFGLKNGQGVWAPVIESGFESQVQIVATTAYVLVMVASIIGICIFYKTASLAENK